MRDQPPAIGLSEERPIGERAAAGAADRLILVYMASHPLVLTSQVENLLGVDAVVARERLDALAAAGLVKHGPRIRYQPGSYQITAAGLREIASELPVPRVDLRHYWQDVIAAWLSLHAHGGLFGKTDRVYSTREMQAADAKAAAAGQRVDPDWSPAVRAKAAESSFAIAPDGDAVNSSARLHYPGLMMVVAQGRVAIELQLTPVGRRSLEAILIAYARKPSIAAVLYLVPDGAIGDAVQAAAARLGLARPVHVQTISLDLAAR